MCQQDIEKYFFEADDTPGMSGVSTVHRNIIFNELMFADIFDNEIGGKEWQTKGDDTPNMSVVS